jgi:anaerobic magnesium-protoporphyrin IX monomethyl ester cyclase
MLYLKDRYRYRSVTFWDDTFTFNKKWVDEFCDRYERTGIGASITACSRADIICNNESMVKRMAEVGVGLLIIGMESGSQRILDLIKKGTTVEQNIEAAKICKKYGIQVFATFMYGLPTETREESLATAKMIDEINPEFPSPFWFTPIRGTDIYDFCEVNDLILDETKERTIARTGVFKASIKGVDYDYIEELMAGGRHGE